MVAISSLSIAANQLRQLLQSQIEGLPAGQIKIGSPKDTFGEMEKETDKSYLNLFFYNVKHDGYPADVTSTNPIFLRVYCLITAVGPKSGSVSAGESDLRLIGEVVRVLHQHPIIALKTNNEVIAELQTVPVSLELDGLNHIWSTQGGIPYRLSVAYEIALIPVPLSEAAEASTLVTGVYVGAQAGIDNSFSAEQPSISFSSPAVDYLAVNTQIKTWSPHICLVAPLNSSTEFGLHYVFNKQGELTDEIDILVAGKEQTSVVFYWNIWRRDIDGTVVTWEENIADKVIPFQKQLVNLSSNAKAFYPEIIDPDNIDNRQIFQVRLPEKISDERTKSWQAQLYAVRVNASDLEAVDFDDNVAAISEGFRSNPILIYGGT